jgi:hypothetical protein
MVREAGRSYCAAEGLKKRIKRQLRIAIQIRAREKSDSKKLVTGKCVSESGPFVTSLSTSDR